MCACRGGRCQDSLLTGPLSCPSCPGAGAVVSPLQKARLCSLCRPLHPDVPILVREALLLHGLLPDDLAGQRGTSLRSVAPPPVAPALGAGQPRLSLEQARQP